MTANARSPRVEPLRCPHCGSDQATKARGGSIYCEGCDRKTSPRGRTRELEQWEKTRELYPGGYDPRRDTFNPRLDR